MEYFIHMKDKLLLEEPIKLTLSEGLLNEAEDDQEAKSPNQDMPDLDQDQTSPGEKQEEEQNKEPETVQEFIDKYGYDEAIDKAEVGNHSVKDEQDPSKKMKNKELRNKVIDSFLVKANINPINDMAVGQKGQDLLHEIFAQLGCESERNNPFITWMKNPSIKRYLHDLSDKDVYDLNNLYAHGVISADDLLKPEGSPMYKQGLLNNNQPIYDLISLYKKYHTAVNEALSDPKPVFFINSKGNKFRPYKEIEKSITNKIKNNELSDKSNLKRSDKGVEATVKLDLPEKVYNKYSKFRDASGKISQANMSKEERDQFTKDFVAAMNAQG